MKAASPSLPLAVHVGRTHYDVPVCLSACPPYCLPAYLSVCLSVVLSSGPAVKLGIDRKRGVVSAKELLDGDVSGAQAVY